MKRTAKKKKKKKLALTQSELKKFILYQANIDLQVACVSRDQLHVELLNAKHEIAILKHATEIEKAKRKARQSASLFQKEKQNYIDNYLAAQKRLKIKMDDFTIEDNGTLTPIEKKGPRGKK